MICSTAAAVSASVAAIYWYLSSRPTPQFSEAPVASISDPPEIFVLGLRWTPATFTLAVTQKPPYVITSKPAIESDRRH